MKIIAIVGSKDTGKTTSIKLSAQLYKDKNLDNSRIVEIESKNTGEEIEGDICKFFLDKKYGKIIAFCSAGDYESVVKNNYQKAIENKANIMVIATRTRGETINALYECAHEHDDFIIKMSTLSNFYDLNYNKINFNELNRLTAEHIVNILNYLLND